MYETKEVDSFCYVDGLTRRIVKGWIEREPPITEIPWTPLKKPLESSTVALISSAGVCLNEDQPFDQQGERENPWWGDPSYRVIPKTATEQEIKVCHLHIDRRFAEEDLNSILPLERLGELESAKKIGRSAENHYSFMGYILKPDVLLSDSTPAIIRGLQADEVDAVVLLPV